jgi:uncharacterized protein (TIGR03067 family)
MIAGREHQRRGEFERLAGRSASQSGARILPKPIKIKMILKRALDFTALSLLMPCLLLGLLAGCKTNQPTAAELQPLQGRWEGVLVGSESAGKITITIAGNSLHYEGLGTNEMVEATFTLPAGTNPQQLRATITGSHNPAGLVDIGQVLTALFKIEDGTLTLAGVHETNQEPPKSFEESDAKRLGRYEFRKVEPQKKNTELPKSK